MQAFSETSLPRPALRQRGFGRELIETIILIGAIYTLVNLASVRFIVEGPSMQPNFHTGQVLIVSRVNYLLGNPQRGEIVVFNPPGQSPENPPYIKRLVGLPGETVEIRYTEVVVPGQDRPQKEPHVYINGAELEEPYVNELYCDNICQDKSWTLGANEYFLMGDNRNHSSDSRRFSTPVTRDRIIGEALVRYWPPEDWGLVGQIAYPNGVNP